jgi:hypothetical protein
MGNPPKNATMASVALVLSLMAPPPQAMCLIKFLFSNFIRKISFSWFYSTDSGVN